MVLQVLVVDDDPGWTAWLARELEKQLLAIGETPDVRCAASPTEARENYERSYFDALIVDFDFGGSEITGAELLASLEDTENIVYVAMISQVGEAKLANALMDLNAGGVRVNHFIVKKRSTPEVISLAMNIARHARLRPMIEPLGTAAKRYREAPGAPERFYAFLSLMEMVARLCTHVLLACLAEERAPWSPLSKFRAGSASGLNVWLTLLQSNLNAPLKRTRPIVAELRKIFGVPNANGETLLDFCQRLRQLRNSASGAAHGIVKDRGYFEQFFADEGMQCEAILQAARKLSFLVLFVPIGPLASRQKNVSVIDAEILNCLHDARRQMRLPNDVAPPTGLVHAWEPAGGFILRLDPLIVYRYCSDCERRVLYLLDRRSRGGQPVYKDAENHETKTTKRS